MAKVIGYGLMAVGYVIQAPGLVWIGQGILMSDTYEQTRRAKRRAIAEYNESLKDRLEMVDITPDQPRTIALGRVRAVEGVRRRWVSGANDQRLTMIVSLAGHEIDAIEQVYFDDVAVSLNGSGYVTTAPYAATRTETITDNALLDGSGNVVMTLTHTPVGSVTATWSTGSGVTGDQGTMTIVSLVGLTLTLSGGPIGGAAHASYSYTTTSYTARVRSYLGAAGQNIGSDLAAEYPGKITSDDKFSGMACLVVDVDYDPDVYPQGRPNVTAVFRGAKVLDPRTGDTEWSENPALCAYHYARHANGWAVPVAEIMAAADVSDEADFCDTETDFTLRKSDGSTSITTLPRHRCGMVISTASDPSASMNEILASMAARSGWAGGVWRFRAGRMPASVFDMDQSWLARRLQDDGTPEPGPTLQFSNGVQRQNKVNRVTGVCVDPAQRYQVLPFPAVEDSVLIAAEGSTYPLEVEYQAVNHIAHAQHLASIAIRRNQASLRLQASCNLWAYRAELFDVGTLTLPTYGINAKTMEVTGWRWHPTEGVQLTLAEITDAIYTVESELVGRDPAPNTDLPAPWEVEDLEDLAVTSGVTSLADGSIVSRTRVAWTAAGSQSVRAGGRVEIQYRQVTDAEWQIWPEDGTNTSAIIPALRGGAYYVFRARFQTAAPLRVRGNWSAMVLHKVAAVPLVGTGGIDTNAVTEVQTYDEDLAGATYGSGTHVISELIFTPAVDCTIEFTALLVASNIDGDSGNQMTWQVTPDGGSPVELGTQSIASASKRMHSAASTYVATGGVELTFELVFSHPGGGNPTMGAWRSYMRATLIKR